MPSNVNFRAVGKRQPYTSCVGEFATSIDTQLDKMHISTVIEFMIYGENTVAQDG